MATVNFSVPEDIKNKFNHLFSGQNKSAILTSLLVKAIEEEELKKNRAEAIDAILSLREKNPPLSANKFNKIRDELKQ